MIDSKALLGVAELEHWKTCPCCHEKGTMNVETADVVCTNPECRRFQSVVR